MATLNKNRHGIDWESRKEAVRALLNGDGREDTRKAFTPESLNSTQAFWFWEAVVEDVTYIRRYLAYLAANSDKL